ncbi:MAG: ABC transporter permease subunit, partial [Clostridia bacterium]|nr:ABC transporter permease subunit [Clostridia bacterium]
NTLFIALLASAISTILGTMAAIGINALRSKRIKAAYSAVNQIPMVNSEIVTAIGLMLLFGLFKTFLPVQGNAELVAVIFAHVAFCTPYVVLNVLPRIRQTDNKIYEAALDLGCTPWQALRKVVLPDIFPGIVMGFMMSVTLSIDDFVITNFTIDGFYTLSTLIYAKASGKKPLPIEMRALSAIIFIVILALMLIITRVNQKSDADKKAVKK